MLKLCTLASGSGGNSLLLTDGKTHILIDAGISCKRITTALKERGLTPEDLSGILITHAHADHIAGLSVLLKQHPLRVYASRETGLELLRRVAFVETMLHTFLPGESFEVGGMEAVSFPTSHDSPGSVGYAVSAGGRKAAVVTDLGVVTDGVLRGIRGTDLLVAEANHDVEFLLSGRYPHYLQQRILSDRGHLSNEAGGALAFRGAQEGAHTVVLAHLSAENNSPQRAYGTVRACLEREGVPVGKELTLEVAPRSAPSRWYEV